MQAIKMFIYRIFECIKPKITNRGDFLELSRTQLMELQKADIEQTAPEKLYDVKELKLNISETVNRRSQRYFKLVQNPYTIRVGDMKVKLNFGNGKTLYDSLLEIAADKNCQ